MRKMPSAAAVALEAQRLRDPLAERALRRREIEPHLAAEETIGAEPAEHEIGVGDGRLGAAVAVADRPRLRRRRFRGPTRSAPPVPTRAMLPPPVPTSWMSIIGICIGRPVA